MNIIQMHNAVKLGVDKTAALDIPAFESWEIDHWLNKAILRFVKTRYSGVNIKRESFEQTQKRVEDLHTLVKTASFALALNADVPNSYVLAGTETWPADHMITISEEVSATVGTSSTSIRMGIKQCTHDEYRQLIDNPYSEHILHYNNAKPLRLFDDDDVRLITDGQYTLSNYYLTYMREPATVSLSGPVNCDLPEHTHDEIVDLTVNILLENIEQPRYKTHSAEIAMME